MQQHRLHALCPYFAMFPPEFARKALLRYTMPGDLVLDPFSGRGTTLLEALLLNRRVLASDVNPVAFCISAAKARPPRLGRLLSVIDDLERGYRRWVRLGSDYHADLPPFFSLAFHRRTLPQILFLRRRLRWKGHSIERFLAALVLGQLHGESDHSPNYFSNQMPHTISTKPDYSLRYWRRHRLQPPERDVFQILREKAVFRLAQGIHQGRARVAWVDVRLVAQRFKAEDGNVSAIITSPPYLDVTNFEEDQWLRLWFLGGPPQPTWATWSSDDRHRSDHLYWEFMKAAWGGLAPLLRRAATIVCRIGSRRLSLPDLEEGLRSSLKSVWPNVRILDAPSISRLKKSRATLMHPKARGCGFEMDVAYRVA